MPDYPDETSGLEPQIGGRLHKPDMTGFEPSLGGAHRFDLRIWSKLIDPRWPHKETLVAGLTLDACQLYASVLVQILPEGASFNETVEGGAALTGRYSPAQRAAAAFVLGLIGVRSGPKMASSLVDPLIARLSTDEDESVRVEAARALGMLGNVRAEAPLIHAMTVGDWKFRLAVIHSLGQVGQIGSLDYLVALYEQSETLNESKAAMESLGVLGGRLAGSPRDQIYEMVMRVFLRSDSLQRGAAARALGHLGDRRALDLLIQLALNGRGELQGAAVEALGILGDPEAVPPLIFVLTTADYPVRQDAVHALIKIGEPSVAPALAVLRHPDIEVRRGIIEVLGKVGAREAVKPLIDLLHDSSIEVRQSCVSALGMIGDPQAVDALIGALSDQDAGVRKEAAMMLSGFRDARAVGPLCLALWDSDMTVRWFAAYALGVHGDPRAVMPLIQALGDRAPNVSQTAIDALIKLGDIAVPAMTRQAFTADQHTRHILVGVLTQIHSTLAEASLAQIAGLSE